MSDTLDSKVAMVWFLKKCFANVYKFNYAEKNYSSALSDQLSANRVIVYLEDADVTRNQSKSA